MGEYFSYANLDRKEYFSIGLINGGITHSSIGYGWGARALGLLLTPSQFEENVDSEPRLTLGAWAGQRIVVVGDTTMEGAVGLSLSEGSISDLWEIIQSEYKVIDSGVLLMLLRHEYIETMKELAERNDGFFIACAELALVHNCSDAVRFVTEAFGDEWQKRYGELRKTSHLRVPPP